jgi:peroxiredoxin
MRIFSIIIFFIISLSSFGQGYSISGRIKGLKDSTCYLTYYYEDQNYIQDSSKASSDGTIVFQGKTPLKGGMYNVMIGRSQSFDMLIGEQRFSFEANIKDIFNTIKFFGSRENDLFYSYQQKTVRDSKRIEELSKKSDTASVNQMYNAQYELVKYKEKFIRAFENTFAGKVIKSTLATDIPPAPKLADGTEDPLWGNKFFVEHYFDNIDLTDDRLIRTPFLYQPVKYYFDQLDFLPNDSLIVLTDKFLNKTRKTSELRKYVVTKLANHYETSKIMGRDAIFVHVLQKYYINDPLMWDTTTIRLVKERVKYLKNLVLGTKIPNLTATDVTGKTRNLYDVKAKNTILYIYGADCGHCQAFTPQLAYYLQENKEKSVEVFAVIFGNNVETLKEFIKEYKSESFINVYDKTGKLNLYQEFDAQFTPTIYILDKDKKIIGKGNMSVKLMDEIISSQ